MTGEELGKEAAFAGTGIAVSYPAALPEGVIDEIRANRYDVPGMSTLTFTAIHLAATYAAKSYLEKHTQKIMAKAVDDAVALMEALAKLHGVEEPAPVTPPDP